MLEGIYYNIDKINCIVQKNIQSDTKIYNTKNVPKVIYKPVFYRTYDLQNISIKPGLVQNIGINLSDYMNKVDSFILSIDGHNFPEIARNDVYTIFKIDSTVISLLTGNYYLLDSDGTYISNGNFNIV